MNKEFLKHRKFLNKIRSILKIYGSQSRCILEGEKYNGCKVPIILNTTLDILSKLSDFSVWLWYRKYYLNINPYLITHEYTKEEEYNNIKNKDKIIYGFTKLT